jgi:hypothetical protein
VLDAFEPPEVPIQIVQLPGVPARAAAAFAEFAFDRFSAPRLPAAKAPGRGDRRGGAKASFGEGAGSRMSAKKPASRG